MLVTEVQDVSTNIGSEEWMQRVTKAALENRANQLNPNNATYWKCRDCKPAPAVNPLLAVLAAAAIGAAAATATIFGVQKILQLKKDKAAENTDEEESEETVEEIVLEEVPEEEVKEEE